MTGPFIELRVEHLAQEHDQERTHQHSIEP